MGRWRGISLYGITDFVSVTYGGITGTNNGDGTYTVNGKARDLFDVYRNYELTANHVYFAMGDALKVETLTHIALHLHRKPTKAVD